MPHEILLAKYLDNLDKLLLVGDSVYLYSFSEKKLRKIIDMPEDWVNYKKYIAFEGQYNNVICVSKSDEEQEKNITISVNLESKSLSRELSMCSHENQTPTSLDENKTKTAEEIFKNLKLPSLYTISQ